MSANGTTTGPRRMQDDFCPPENSCLPALRDSRAAGVPDSRPGLPDVG
jgi:hypothetical protein